MELTDMELTDIVLTEITYNQIKLKLINLIVLIPEKKAGLLIVKDRRICLYVYSNTRKGLLQEINEQIVYMWQHYVECNIDTLAEDAKKLRANLLATFEKII